MAISIGDALLKIGVDKKDFDRDMKGIGASIKKHQKAIGIGMVAMGAAIFAGLGLSLKAAADFEGAMREVNTMMGLSQDEFADFSKQVQALASDLGVDAVESAKALYQAISAGVPKENVLEFLAIATKAAIGGVTDTETAVDGLTTVINAFKLPMSDAQRVADIMFTTVKGGKTTFEELSASIFQVAPIAAASGVRFEEVAAALATMTKQGVPTKIATTQLRQAMVALQKPTEDMNKIISELGYESGQTMLAELGLAETLNILRDATSGSNEMLMKMFGSVEAGQAVLALTGDNAEVFATDLDAMASSAGAATDAFNEMEKSATRQLEALKNSFKGIAISIGTVLLPLLKKLLDKLKPIIESIKNWTDEHPRLTEVITKTTLALGALLLVIGTAIVLKIPALIGALITLAKTFLFTVIPAVWGLVTALWAQVTATLAALAATGAGIPAAILAGLAIVALAVGITLLVKSQKKQYEATEAVTEATDVLTETTDKATEAQDQYGVSTDATTGAINRQIGAITELSDTMRTTAADVFITYAQLGKITPFQLEQQKAFGRMLGIPGFGEGGIVTRPTLAMIGERGPEAVVPLDRMFKTANIYVQLDGRTIAKAIGQPLVDEIRIQTGVKM